MEGQVVLRRREKIEKWMTCPLCNKLLKEATTVTECLHTFCRECIYQKITEEDLNCCPECKTYLGCNPLDKLRPDHSIQDLRAKIFPSKKPKAKLVDAVPSVPLPTRRKERSLSSLVVDTPRVSAPTRGRRKSSGKRDHAPQEPAFPLEEPTKEVKDLLGRSSSPETINKIVQNIVKDAKDLTIAESSKQHMLNKGKAIAEPCEEKADLWLSLNGPIEAASIATFCKSDPLGSFGKSAPSYAHGDEAFAPKAKVKESDNKLKLHDDGNGSTPVPVKPRKPKGIQEKRAAASELFNIPAQAIVDASTRCDQRFTPFWFSLIASSPRKGVEPLPQISSYYLRIKDGNITVSYIKKYIVKKLGLISEDEVEILMWDQTVANTWRLYELVDFWVQSAPPSERIQTTVGSSAKDALMVLSYGRKVYAP